MPYELFFLLESPCLMEFEGVSELVLLLSFCVAIPVLTQNSVDPDLWRLIWVYMYAVCQRPFYGIQGIYG